jgi:hypothetical protein
MVKFPSFIDSHCHFLGCGYAKTLVQLNNITSISELQVLLHLHLEKPFILGRGWNQESLSEKRFITRFDLDEVSKTIPIVLIRACGHVISVNSAMISLMELKNVKLDEATSIENGIFVEDDIHLVYDLLPKPDKHQLKKYLQIANQLYLSNGVTSVASDDFCIFDIPYENVIEAILESYEENLIQVRITEQVNLPSKEVFQDFIAKGYVNKNYGPYKMGPLKLLSDGSLGGRTAALKLPYSDDYPNTGVKTFSDEELFQLVHMADIQGMDVAIHAIGDAAMDQVLDAMIKSLHITHRTNHHHAVIHAQLANLEHIKLMKEYHIGAIVQPVFLNSDISMLHERLGLRKEETYLFHTMYLNHLCVGFSTDAPVENISPFENIYIAMSRKSIKNPLLDQHLRKEAFSLDEALECYLINNLVYTYEANRSSGDFVMLDKSPYNLDLNAMKDIKILETWKDGICVYKK